MVLEYSDNGNTWITNLPTPSTLSISAQDLDDASYRSVTNGNIIRKIVGYKWQKVSVSYNGLSERDANDLMYWCYNANNKYIRVYSPIDSTYDGGEHFIKTLQGYISQIESEWVQTGSNVGVWNISFSFIEGKR